MEFPNGHVLGYRIPEGEINAGQVELPGPGLLQPVASAKALAKTLARRFAVQLEVGRPLVTVRHAITHHRIALTVHRAVLLGGTGNLLKVYPGDPAQPWTTASRKVFGKLDTGPGDSGLLS